MNSHTKRASFGFYITPYSGLCHLTQKRHIAMSHHWELELMPVPDLFGVLHVFTRD